MYKGVRRIFFDKTTGERIQEIGRNGSFILPTVDQDIAVFTVLSERNRDTFDVLELPFESFAQDFIECNGYRVNPKTKELEFSYPDPNDPEAPIVYQKPLSEQVTELEARTKATEDALLAIMTNGGI